MTASCRTGAPGRCLAACARRLTAGRARRQAVASYCICRNRTSDRRVHIGLGRECAREDAEHVESKLRAVVGVVGLQSRRVFSKANKRESQRDFEEEGMGPAEAEVDDTDRTLRGRDLGIAGPAARRAGVCLSLFVLAQCALGLLILTVLASGPQLPVLIVCVSLLQSRSYLSSPTRRGRE
jgi:hypothetical protein